MVALLNDELRNQQALSGAQARQTARNTYESLVETGKAIVSDERKEELSESSALNAIAEDFLETRALLEKEGKSAEEAALHYAQGIYESLYGKKYGADTYEKNLLEQEINTLWEQQKAEEEA